MAIQPELLREMWAKLETEEGMDIHQVFSWLIEAGANDETIRRACLGDEPCCREFQRAFLENALAWAKFGFSDLVHMLLEIASVQPEKVLIIYEHIRASLGNHDAWPIAIRAVDRLESVVNSQTIEVLRRLNLPQSLQVGLSLRLVPTWRTIPLIVQGLKGLADGDGSKKECFRRHLWSRNYPLTIPCALRWAMLGGEPYRFPPKFEMLPLQNDFVEWPSNVHQVSWYMSLRRRMEDAGWCFIKLQARTIESTERLVAVVNMPSMSTVVYIHKPGERGEQLKEGDEVMVWMNPKFPFAVNHVLDKRHITWKRVGNEVVVEYELHPTTPPTQAMLADPNKFFSGGDIPTTPEPR